MPQHELEPGGRGGNELRNLSISKKNTLALGVLVYFSLWLLHLFSSRKLFWIFDLSGCFVSRTTDISRIRGHCLETSHSAIKTFPFKMHSQLLLNIYIPSVSSREWNQTRSFNFSSLISSCFDWGLRVSRNSSGCDLFLFIPYSCQFLRALCFAKLAKPSFHYN